MGRTAAKLRNKSVFVGFLQTHVFFLQTHVPISPAPCILQTHTGLFLNFAAVCPIKWKSGLVFCMLHRAKLICLSDLLFFKEVEILKSLFLANNYPSQFFDKILRKFLTLSSHHTQENKNSNECETCFFKVLYIGFASKQFKKVSLNLFIGNLVSS